MKTLTEYLNRNSFENKVGRIIFQLDESSLEFLDDEFQQFILEGKSYHHGNRIIWTSNDGDNLRMGDHATQRQDRQIEKGGDGGKRISQEEIINMFVWAWGDIIEMNYDGKLKPMMYNGKQGSFTIECQCWLIQDKEYNNKIKYNGARPKNMNLWAAWMLEENGTKMDIIVKTIFRGQTFMHAKSQERIRIDSQGNVLQRY